MNRRLGNHRVRPALSNAARAKPEIAALDRRIAEARAKGDMVVCEKLKTQRAWVIANSLR